eukprot:symbB.v1.2.028663.t1/scaffold3060.1/size64454/2
MSAIYLWKICTRRSCSCKLCRNGYRSLDLLGCGGYGSVYLVERMPALERFVSKKIPVREITEVDEYSREAKELIMLRHRHIVSYEEDFVHVEYGGLEPKTLRICFCVLRSTILAPEQPGKKPQKIPAMSLPIPTGFKTEAGEWSDEAKERFFGAKNEEARPRNLVARWVDTLNLVEWMY